MAIRGGAEHHTATSVLQHSSLVLNMQYVDTFADKWVQD